MSSSFFGYCSVAIVSSDQYIYIVYIYIYIYIYISPCTGMVEPGRGLGGVGLSPPTFSENIKRRVSSTRLTLYRVSVTMSTDMSADTRPRRSYNRHDPKSVGCPRTHLHKALHSTLNIRLLNYCQFRNLSKISLFAFLFVIVIAYKKWKWARKAVTEKSISVPPWTWKQS